MFNNKRCSFTRKSVSSAPVLSAYTITLGWHENSHHRHGDLALKYRLESSSRNFCNLKKNRMSQTSGQVTTYLSHTHTHTHTHTRAHTHTHTQLASAQRTDVLTRKWELLLQNLVWVTINRVRRGNWSFHVWFVVEVNAIWQKMSMHYICLVATNHALFSISSEAIW